MTTQQPTQPSLGRVAPYEPGSDPHSPHYCTDQCICPIHRLQLFYSKQFRKHACQVPDCVHAHGMRPRQPVMDEPGFESVRIMRLQPGDVIVVQVRDAGNERDRDRFLARLERVFPEHKAIIVDNGAEISIARPDSEA